MTRIRFRTSGSNLTTAMSVKESVRRQLREVGIEYREITQLPFVVEMSDRDYVLFCLAWDDSTCEWRAEKGLQG